LDKGERERKLFEQNLRIRDLEVQNHQKQARILSILLGIFVISLGVGYSFYQKKQVFNYRISKRNKQLEVLNDTKDRLFGIISHDLRAPVVDLINTLSLLENTNLTTEQLSGLLRKKVLNLQTLLNNLLYWALSQRQLLRINPKIISLKNSVGDTLDLLSGLTQEKALQISGLNSVTDSIYADENHLRIILYSVIHNAIKFSPTYGVIEIATATEASYVLLHLTNKGEAFEGDGNRHVESHLGTLGENGTGLGLSVCAELIKSNQGNIYAFKHTTGTTGTTVVIALPNGMPYR